MNVILASASPRRQELLKLIFPSFTVKPSDVDETAPGGILPSELPVYLAKKKAGSIAKNLSGDFLVIGCDTCVIAQGEVLGKPRDKNDAMRMLKLLSGNEHSVVTGCCLITDKSEFSFSETTLVKFNKLSDGEIMDYINTGEPFDKAGAYGIQGYGALLVDSIKGDFFNVVGLPVSRLGREIKNVLK